MYSNILKYQEYDLEILKLNKKIQNSEYKKVISSMVQKNKDIQTTKDNLEVEAKVILDSILELQTAISKEKAELEKIEKDFTADEGVLEENTKKANDVSFKLNGLLKKLVKAQKDAEEIEKKYDELKKNATIVKTNYKNAKDAQDKLIQKEESQIKALKQEQKNLESGIEPSIMQEYLKYKADNIMPVYVKIFNDDCCGGCMQKLSTSQLAKNDNKLVCEMCRRIIIRNN